MADEGRCSPVSSISTEYSSSTGMAEDENISSSIDSKSDNKTKVAEIPFKVPGTISSIPVSKTSARIEVEIKRECESSPDPQSEDSHDQNIKETTENIKQEKNTELKHSKQPNTSSLSPAEQLKNAQVIFPYKEPSWSGLCEGGYQFEVVKNGSIIDSVDLTKKPFYVFGRLPSCDVTMEHPSLSRHHAVMQYSSSIGKEREKGWYLYDLDSTHGTWINKVKIRPKVYNRVRVGHVVKLGGSSRLHILQGPEDDQEEETELSVTELKQQNERQKKEAEVLHQAELLEEENRMQKEKQRMEDRGCTWGIDEDAEEPPEENPFVPTNVAAQNEHLYIDDPKKALKGYFEREGYDLPEYQFVDCGPGKHKCMVELPVDTPSGEPVIAEVVVSGKRKDAVVACALEACRLLDKHGELRKAKHESHKRKAKNWEDNDFYDSDEDTFLDRTGTIEKKRAQRMKRAGKMEDKAETYESLLEKHTSVTKEMAEIEAKLEKAKADAAAFEDEEVDALDAYMSAIKSGVMDTKTKMMLKRQMIELKQEEQKLRRLVNLAKPASLPELKKQELPPPKPVAKVAGSTVGKIHKGPRKPLPVPTQKLKPVSRDSDDEVEEDEDEDDITDKTVSSTNSVTSSGNSKSGDERLQTDNITKVTSEPDSTSGKVKGPAMPPPSVTSSKTIAGMSSTKVKGPILPPDTDTGDPDSTQESIKEKKLPETVSKPQKRSSVGADKVKSKKKKTVNKTDNSDYDKTDPNYAVWMPPVGQSGDGKTHLNDKYGY